MSIAVLVVFSEASWLNTQLRHSYNLSVSQSIKQHF